MKIEHIAFWVNELDLMRVFYLNYSKLASTEKYYNPQKEFTSYFLSFGQGKAGMELMHRPYVLGTRA